MKRNGIRFTFHVKRLCGLINPNASELCRLANAQIGHRRERIGGRKANPDSSCLGIQFDAVKLARIKRKPKAERRNVNALAEGIERRSTNRVAGSSDVSAEDDPAELRMVDDVRRRVQGVAEEIRAIVARFRIELQHIREGVEGGGGKSFLIDVRKRTHRAAISDTKKIEIIGVLAILGKQRNRVDARAVMVQLSFETLNFRGI